MGRPRSKKSTCPSHIDASKLPKNCYWDNSGKGHWYTNYVDDDGRRRRVKIAGRDATLADLHRLIEEQDGVLMASFQWLADEFEKSPQFRQVSKAQRKDWIYCKKVVVTFPSRNRGIPLGQTDRAKWTTPNIQKIIDTVADTRGPSSAKHVYTYLKRVFNWGVNRGYSQKNPVQAIELPKERKRRRLPPIEVVNSLVMFAQERAQRISRTKGSCPHYIWMALELSYLNRLRGIEVFKTTDAQVTESGLECVRAKGSSDNVTKWNPRLRNVVDAAQAYREGIWAKKKRPYPMRPEHRHLLVNASGDSIKQSSWQSSWRRFMELAIKEEIITKEQWFGLHDMKRRGATDTKGTKAEKMEATGHHSRQMLDIYDHSVPLVDASSE